VASVAFGARLVVSAALIAAGVMKLRIRRSLRAQVAAFGVPGVVTPVVAAGLPFVELTAGAALLVFVRSAVPVWIALAILALFTGAVAANLATGRHVPCPCFGTSAAVITPGTLVRNAWLVALAVVATGSVAGASPGATAAWTVAFGLATVVVVSFFG
jgi:hypothetical protein